MSTVNGIDFLRLIDSDNNIYNFPDDFWISDDGWQVSSNIKNIAFFAGGKNIADKYLEARTITIEGFVRADDKYELETKFRALSKAVLQGGRLFVIGDTVNRYMDVSSPKVDSNYSNDYRLEKQYNISYLVEYPFWQETNQTILSFLIEQTTGPDTFQIDNSESDFLVLPEIRFDADQGEDIPYIRLLNLSDGGMFFEYQDPNFIAGDYLIINSATGTVERNGNDSNVYFITPRFLRLQNIINNFIYEGNACTITVTFRKIYL